MFTVYLNADGASAQEVIGRVERNFAGIYRCVERIWRLDEDAVLGHHDRAYSPHWGSPLENLKREIAFAAEGAPRIEFIVGFTKELHYTFEHVVSLEGLMGHDEVVADPIILDAHNSWPFMIKLYRHHGEGLRNEARLRDLLIDVEIVLLKLSFHHGNSSNKLVAITKRYDGTDESFTALCAEFRELTSRGFNWRCDFDTRVQDRLDGDDHYTPNFRYILWKYENWRRRDGDMVLLPADYMNFIGSRRMESTIEHIAPQKGKYEEEFRNKWINNVGNLLLMPRGMNSSFSYMPPLEKAAGMDTSYKSHREVREVILASGGWGEHEIAARKDRIVDFIRERWRLSTDTGLRNP